MKEFLNSLVSAISLTNPGQAGKQTADVIRNMTKVQLRGVSKRLKVLTALVDEALDKRKEITDDSLSFIAAYAHAQQGSVIRSNRARLYEFQEQRLVDIAYGQSPTDGEYRGGWSIVAPLS